MMNSDAIGRTAAARRRERGAGDDGADVSRAADAQHAADGVITMDETLSISVEEEREVEEDGLAMAVGWREKPCSILCCDGGWLKGLFLSIFPGASTRVSYHR